MNNKRKAATEQLLSLGFKAGNSGFYYLVDLMVMRLNGEEIAPLSTRGYVEVGRKYAKSAATVDKSIQNAISGAWTRGDIERLYMQFGNTVSSDRDWVSMFSFSIWSAKVAGSSCSPWPSTRYS